jgi:hypothetical protein
MINTTHTTRSPLPPFTLETAKQKVRMAEDGWNNRDPEIASLAYRELLKLRKVAARISMPLPGMGSNWSMSKSKAAPATSRMHGRAQRRKVSQRPAVDG